MKYRNIFKTMEEYNNSSLSYPNISLITDDNKVIVSNKQTQPNNEIWYTTTDGKIVEPRNEKGFVSNTYDDVIGVITLENESTSLGTNAFMNCHNLKTIEIPSNIVTIGISSFQGCENLEAIKIPSGVNEIMTRTFLICTSLTSITYNGTSIQFNNITKENYWKEFVPSSCIVHCTDGDFPIIQFN